MAWEYNFVILTCFVIYFQMEYLKIYRLLLHFVSECKTIYTYTVSQIHASSDSIRFKTKLLFTKPIFLAFLVVHHQNSEL